MDDVFSPVDELRLRENASRGAAILDEEVSEWHWEVKLTDLDMKDPTKCIAGQIGWERMRQITTRLQVLPSELGLVRLQYNSPNYDWEDTYLEEYGILKDQWECEIRRRRQVDGTREYGAQEQSR